MSYKPTGKENGRPRAGAGHPMHYNIRVSLKDSGVVHTFPAVGKQAVQAFIDALQDDDDCLDVDVDADMGSYLAQHYPAYAARLPAARVEAEARRQGERDVLEALYKDEKRQPSSIDLLEKILRRAG